MNLTLLLHTTALFEYYKGLGDTALSRLTDEQFFAHQDSGNSIAVIVQHMAGNMKSRFTDFLTTDGEKPWRHRDAEFEAPMRSRKALMQEWSEGWNLLLMTLRSLSESDLSKTVYIRNEGHSVTDAILRQLAHYSYHVGQIVYSAKQLIGDNWQSLSIPKGSSDAYNSGKFSQPKVSRHFTEKL